MLFTILYYLQEFQHGKDVFQTTTIVRKKLNKLESLFQQINNQACEQGLINCPLILS